MPRATIFIPLMEVRPATGASPLERAYRRLGSELRPYGLYPIGSAQIEKWNNDGIKVSWEVTADHEEWVRTRAY
jgi:hypothetical protein